ncbi:MAG: kelch repeat-containing protein, partial [Polyangiaceae bacterium]
LTTGSGTLNHPRYHAVAAALSTGDVLVVGGEDGSGNYRDAELYDPTTTSFSDFCGMSEGSAYGHTVTLLADGQALVAGGHGYSPSRILGFSNAFDLTVDAGAVPAGDGGFTLDDASACDHPVVVISDSGSPTDASSDDAALPISDAAPTESDADVDANGPSKPPTASDASSSSPESDGFAAGGGCRMTSVSERESPVFFAGFAIFFVLIRSRRWQHFARRSRPFS